MTATVSTNLSTLSVQSPSKLNLFLDIVSKRTDGYHDIVTLFERISLCDVINLTATVANKIVVTANTKDIPCDKNNLVYKAADLIKKRHNVKFGVKIGIEKNIPVGAGLGGGSGNAASVLLGLNKLFDLKIKKETLIDYANELGSDVAFFVLDKRFAVGSGRGGELKALRVNKSVVLWHILFALPIKVLTKDVYKAWDNEALEAESFRLTKKEPNVNMLVPILRQNKLFLLNQNMYNRLSETVMKSYSFVSELRTDLLKSGLKFVHMSGSGPTLFSCFSEKKDALKAFEKAQASFSDRCRIFLVNTA